MFNHRKLTTESETESGKRRLELSTQETRSYGSFKPCRSLCAPTAAAPPFLPREGIFISNPYEFKKIANAARLHPRVYPRLSQAYSGVSEAYPRHSQDPRRALGPRHWDGQYGQYEHGVGCRGSELKYVCYSGFSSKLPRAGPANTLKYNTFI